MNTGFRPDDTALPPPLASAADPAPAEGARRTDGRMTMVVVPLLMLAASLLVRWLSFVPAVIDTDEGLYIVQAREWLHGGGWPLVAVWDMHPVGAPVLVALVMAALGDGIGAVRLLGSLMVALSGVGLYGLARAAGAPRALALGAGLIYVAHTPLLGGLATNTEVLFAPFVVAAMALGTRGAIRALDANEAPRWRDLVAMGALVGFALTVKPVAAPGGSLAFALLTLPAWWRGALPLRRALMMALAYAALCAAPTVLLGLAYAAQGELWTYLNAILLAPLSYGGSRLSLSDAAWEILTAVLTLAWPFALTGFALLRWSGAPEATERRLLLIGALWFAAATVAVAAPGMFFNHYFLIWLAPLSLLAAVGMLRLAKALRPRRVGIVFAAILGVVAADAWRTDAIPRLQRGVGLRIPDPPREVAKALAAAIPPGAPVLIANYHPVVYALARVGIATRYVFPAQLTGRFGKVAGIDMDAEVARVLATRPEAIVVDRGWWGAMRPTVAAMLATALKDGYALAATVPEERGPVEIWCRRADAGRAEGSQGKPDEEARP